MSIYTELCIDWGHAVEDGVKFFLGEDADHAQDLFEEFERTILRNWDQEEVPHIKYTALPANKRRGTQYYAEAWGYAAQLIYHLPYASWSPRLVRLDVKKWSSSLTPERAQEIGWEFNQCDGYYNIHLHNKGKAGYKKGAKVGGKGFSIGSHKSDVRVTVYGRRKSLCGMEMQVSGRALKNVVKKASELKPEFDTDAARWGWLRGWVWNKGWERVNYCVDLLQKRHDEALERQVAAILDDGSAIDFETGEVFASPDAAIVMQYLGPGSTE